MAILSTNIRNHLVAGVAEMAGTFMFLLFAFAIAQVANTPASTSARDAPMDPNILRILFISLGFGCSVAINVWLFFRISGGMFNPAVRFAQVGGQMILICTHRSR
jgi:aquaporin related protein